MSRRRRPNLRHPLLITCYTTAALAILLIPLTFLRVARLGRIGVRSTLVVHFYNARVFILYQWGPAISFAHARAGVVPGQYLTEFVANDLRDRDPRGAFTPAFDYRPPGAGAVATNAFHSLIINLPLWLIALTALVPPAILSWRARHTVPPGHCPKCRYNLTANTSGTCPECGRPILAPTPTPATTRQPDPPSSL